MMQEVVFLKKNMILAISGVALRALLFTCNESVTQVYTPFFSLERYVFHERHLRDSSSFRSKKISNRPTAYTDKRVKELYRLVFDSNGPLDMFRI